MLNPISPPNWTRQRNHDWFQAFVASKNSQFYARIFNFIRWEVEKPFDSFTPMKIPSISIWRALIAPIARKYVYDTPRSIPIVMAVRHALLSIMRMKSFRIFEPMKAMHIQTGWRAVEAQLFHLRFSTRESHAISVILEIQAILNRILYLVLTQIWTRTILEDSKLELYLELLNIRTERIHWDKDKNGMEWNKTWVISGLI